MERRSVWRLVEALVRKLVVVVAVEAVGGAHDEVLDVRTCRGG